MGRTLNRIDRIRSCSALRKSWTSVRSLVLRYVASNVDSNRNVHLLSCHCSHLLRWISIRGQSLQVHKDDGPPTLGRGYTDRVWNCQCGCVLRQCCCSIERTRNLLVVFMLSHVLICLQSIPSEYVATKSRICCVWICDAYWIRLCNRSIRIE